VRQGLVWKGLGFRLYWLGTFFILGVCISVYNIRDAVSQSLHLRGRIGMRKVWFENNAVLFQIA
jgi:hypothetical protein